MTKTRICKVCGVSFPVERPRVAAKTCSPECMAANSKATMKRVSAKWEKSNRPRRQRIKRAFRERHAEELAAAREQTRDAQREWHRNYYAANRERLRARQRELYAKKARGQ